MIIEGAGEVEAPGFHPTQPHATELISRPLTKERTRWGEHHGPLRTFSSLQDREGPDGLSRVGGAPASRYRKDTLGSDRWLQSREFGVCPSRCSRKVNVGQAPSPHDS